MQMTANSSTTSTDGEFEAFLAEVDRLSISDAQPDENNGSSVNNGSHDHDDINAKACTKHIPRTTSYGAEKRHMISNAGESRRAWSEFKRMDLSSSRRPTGDGDKPTPKVSFQIKSGKEKKKKKKKGKIVSKVRGGKVSECDVRSECSSPPDTTAAPLSADSMSYKCPSWTLVIDTCCTIEKNGNDMQRLINLAKHAAKSCEANRNLPSSALMAMAVDEPITIILPFTIWRELEHQSKSENSRNAYAARVAMRIMRDEIELAESPGSRSKVLHLQSLTESRNAEANFLGADSGVTNDDRILACALNEVNRAKDESNTFKNDFAMRTEVLVTLDNNLMCKAQACGLRVNTPLEFIEYYEKRMRSLRQRAAQSLADSALRR